MPSVSNGEDEKAAFAGAEQRGLETAKRHFAWRLRRLFTRKRDGFGARAPGIYVGLLADPFRSGMLRVEMRRLPAAACEEAAGLPRLSQRGESQDHIRMKHAGRTWMRLSGARDAELEVAGYDGRFDAYSLSHDWIVECGNSNIDKLVEAIGDADRPRFTLIPWQDVERHDGSPRRLIAADFSWDRELRDILIHAIAEDQAARMQRVERAYRNRMIAEAQARKAEREAALPASAGRDAR